MYIRELKMKDAPYMLEWMHDKSVVNKLKTNFISKTLEDVENFINNSMSNKNIHYAICSDSDEYMGTVSIKNINKKENNAEFGIAIRNCAMGKDYSWFAMKEILKRAFAEININSIYWCVAKDNLRALKFYNKHGFQICDYVPNSILNYYKEDRNLVWYFCDKKFYNKIGEK